MQYTAQLEVLRAAVHAGYLELLDGFRTVEQRRLDYTKRRFPHVSDTDRPAFEQLYLDTVSVVTQHIGLNGLS